MEKKSNFFERILQIIDYYGIKNVNNFALNWLNYTSSEKINRLKKENTNPSYEIIIDITNKFEDVNPEWLLTGNGPMLKPSKDEQDSILPAYQCLNENTNQGIPLIPSSAMAGFFTGDIQVLEYECERFIIPSFKDADFLISVKGSSMEPKYSSGDLVACKRMSIDTFFQWNKVYVLDTEQGPLIKRVNEGKNENTLLICSENPKYPPFQLNRSLIHNIALVVGVIRLE